MLATGPQDELSRPTELRNYAILDSPLEQDYEGVTALASCICVTPYSLISLVDEHRHRLK